LIKAGHGLIENNTIDNGHSGVTVNSESGLTAISHLTIRNNQIIGTGHFMPAAYSNQAGSISFVEGTNPNNIAPAGVFDQIVVENNAFSDVSGVNMVFTSTNNLKVKSNIFRKTGLSTPNNTGSDCGIDQNTVVYIKNCNTVLLDSNAVINRELSRLLVTAGVTNLTNLHGGVFDVQESGISDISLSGDDSGALFFKNQSIIFRSPEDMNETITCRVYNCLGQLERSVKVNAGGKETTFTYQPIDAGIKIVRIEGKSFKKSGKLFVDYPNI
jgi:hypothetical protein